MEIGSGYKRTYLGIIPNDWEIKALLTICSMKSGEGTTSRDIEESSSYPCYGGNGLRGYTKRYTHEGRYALIGRQGALCGNVLGVDGKFFASEHAVVVTAFPQTDIGWLTYALGEMHLNRYSESSAQPGLSVAKLRKLEVVVPPDKSEQCAIAEALSDVDALIDWLNKLIAKKLDIKQGAMQELLVGEERLAGIHSEWERKAVSELASISKGTQLKTSKSKPTGEFPHYNGGMVPSNYTDEFNSGAETIVVSEGGNSCGYVQFVKEPFWAGGHCYALNPIGVHKKFFYHALKFKQSEIMLLRVGSGLPNIQKHAIEAFDLRLPNEMEEQLSIAGVLDDMDAEVSALEQRRDKTVALKQGMMQALLSGRIRLVPRARTTARHNWQFNEAVIIGVISNRFGTIEWPLPRKRCTKLTYLFHRHAEHKAEGYLKKAAGPYNPATRYKGPEDIAQRNGYVRLLHNGGYQGFVAADNCGQAETYFRKWYGEDAFDWLEKFHYKKTEELELLATVDMAMEDLRSEAKPVDMESVKRIIGEHPEWQAKLEREVFSDANIERAIEECSELFADSRNGK